MQRHRKHVETVRGTPAAAKAETALKHAEAVQKQRRELFELVRTKVFGAQQATQAAVARLRQRRASDDAIRAFEERAARSATAEQVATLEREVV